MSKELTEKWWKNELPVGHYYIKYDGCSPFIYHFYKMTELKQCADANKIEVLAPVPTFNEYQALLSDQLAKDEGVEINAELQNQIAEASKKVKELEEQLKEAQNLIIYCSSGNHLGYEVMCENYMHKYHLSKWGVK